MFGVIPQNPKPPCETETDIATGAMAFEAARYGRKLVRCDTDLEKYRRRMNAVADAQAIRMGANPEDLQQPVGEDEMNVFTNSPVTHNYPLHRSQLASVMGAWLLGILTIIMLVITLFMLAWFLKTYTPTPTPTPEPVPTESSNLHIKVIPSGD